jgi:hypothetical protein
VSVNAISTAKFIAEILLISFLLNRFVFIIIIF